MGKLEEGQMLVSVGWQREVDRRLDEHMERIDQHDERLRKGDERFEQLDGKMDENTTLTEQAKAVAVSVKEDTSALVAAFKAWGGFTTVTKWFIAFVVGAAALVLAGGVLYWAIATKTLPFPGKAPPGVEQTR